MRLLWAVMLVLSFAAPAAADDHIALRVLYCGDPGSDREADFRKFLEQHFAKVTLHDYRTFTEADAKGQDVVIFDWTYEYDGKGSIDPQRTRRWHPPNLSQDFSRPVDSHRTGRGPGVESAQAQDQLALPVSRRTGPSSAARSFPVSQAARSRSQTGADADAGELSLSHARQKTRPDDDRVESAVQGLS